MDKAQNQNSQYITVEESPEKADRFRQQMKKPYFRAQVNANVYLVNNLGHLLLAGEPQLAGHELHIPVYHSFIGQKESIGFLCANPQTLKVYDDPDLWRTLRKTVGER